MRISGLFLSSVLILLEAFGISFLIYDSTTNQAPFRGLIIIAVASLLAASWMVTLWAFGFYKRNATIGAYHLVTVSGMCLLLIAHILLLALFRTQIQYILWGILNVWAVMLVSLLEARALYNVRIRNMTTGSIELGHLS